MRNKDRLSKPRTKILSILLPCGVSLTFSSFLPPSLSSFLLSFPHPPLSFFLFLPGPSPCPSPFYCTDSSLLSSKFKLLFLLWKCTTMPITNLLINQDNLILQLCPMYTHIKLQLGCGPYLLDTEVDTEINAIF